MPQLLQKLLILNICLGFVWSQFWVSPALFLITLAAFAGTMAFRGESVPQCEPIGMPTSTHLGWGLFALLPGLVTLVLGWNSEFPFSGDYDHHVMVFQRLQSLPAYLWAVPSVLVIGQMIWGQRHWGSGIVAAAILFFLASFYSGSVQDVARYPTGAYLITGLLASLLDPLLSIRIYEWQKLVNFLSIPFGLFVIRPWLLRRWPDAQAAVLFLVLTLQKDLNYFFNTNYLEPWSVVLVALSIEAFLLERRTRLQALMTLSAACMFKEQAVFFLGAGWLVYSLSERSLSVWKRLLLGFQLLAPFLIYYLIRRSGGVWRTTEIASLQQAFGAEQLAEYFYRIQLHLAPTGVLLLLGFAALLMWSYRKGNVPVAFWFFAGAAGFLKFLSFADKISMEYAGYPRFHFFGWALLAAMSAYFLSKYTKDLRMRIVALIFVLICQFPGLADYWQRMSGPWDRMSSLEHYGTPLYFPLRELLGGFAGSYPFQILEIVSPMSNQKIATALGAGYSDLVVGLSIRVADTQASCKCGESGMAVVSFLPPDSSRILLPLGKGANSNTSDVDRFVSCGLMIQASCSKFRISRDSARRTWGVLGY